MSPQFFTAGRINNLPMIVPAGQVALVRGNPVNITAVTSAASMQQKPLVRPSPVVTFAAPTESPNNSVSVLAYTPDQSPQSLATHHVSPQTTPVVTYTPQPSPQSPNFGSYGQHISPSSTQNNLTHSSSHPLVAESGGKSSGDPVVADLNQPLNLSTNSALIAPVRAVGNPTSSLPIRTSFPEEQTIGKLAPSTQVQQQGILPGQQTNQASWIIQQQDKANLQIPKVEFKIVNDSCGTQIIRPMNNVPAAKVGSLPNMVCETENSRMLQQVSGMANQIVRSSSSASNNAPPTLVSYSPGCISFNSSPQQPQEHTLIATPVVPPQTTLLSPSRNNDAGASSPLIIPGSRSGKLDSHTTAEGLPNGNPGANPTFMPIIQSSSGVHHIPLRIAASGSNLFNIISPELGYKIIAAEQPFNGTKPLTIALPQEGTLVCNFSKLVHFFIYWSTLCNKSSKKAFQ